MRGEIGFHPAAVAATTDVARAARDEVDRTVAADPAAFRAATGKLVHAPPSPERAATLNQGFDRSYAAFTRSDWELNTLPQHPIEYVFESAAGDAGLIDLPSRLEGVEGYLEGMIQYREAWDELTLHSEAVAQVAPGRILNLARFRLRGPASGIELEQPLAVLFTWEGDWLVLQQYWWDVEAGTRAAGVDPAALHSQV